MPRTCTVYPTLATLARRFEAAVRKARGLYENAPQGLRDHLAALREVRDLIAEGWTGPQTRAAAIERVRRWTAIHARVGRGDGDLAGSLLTLRWGW